MTTRAAPRTASEAVAGTEEDPARQLDHIGCDLEESQAQCVELDVTRRGAHGSGDQTQSKQETVGRDMEQEAEEVSDEATTREPVGVERIFEVLDTVLALASRAQAVVRSIEYVRDAMPHRRLAPLAQKALERYWARAAWSL